MRVDCEIINATIISSQGRFRGTIAVSEGRIAGLTAEPSGNAARTIDAEGLFALPGMVDQHVHFMDPGDTSREDFVHGSGAAAVGGVTTVIEHTHSNPVLTAENLREKREYLKERSVIDF